MELNVATVKLNVVCVKLYFVYVELNFASVKLNLVCVKSTWKWYSLLKILSANQYAALSISQKYSEIQR